MNKDEVIQRINMDIVGIVEGYMELKNKQHGTTLIGLCPFHNEKTPSFKVTPARGRYKCFGCGKGGDAIDFIMEQEHTGFMESLKIGAKKLGLSVDWEEAVKGFDSEEFKHKESLRIVCEKAAEFYQKCLSENKKAQDFLAMRNFITGEEDPLMLGYAPAGNAFLKWGKENGLNLALMKEAGLISTNEDTHEDYDYFRDRIMFPVCEKSGKVIGFSGRLLGEKKGVPKYVNSPDTPIYRKGNELYGLNVARKMINTENRAYLVEGNFDVKRLHSIGVINTVAACGTALTPEQIQLLKTFTPNISLIYDGDDAGRKAIERNGDMLTRAQCNVHVIVIEDGEDPDSLFTSIEKFDEFKDNKQTEYLIYKTKLGAAKCKSSAFKSEFIKEISSLIACYDSESMREVQVDAVAEIIKGHKKLWQNTVKTMVAEKAPVVVTRNIPDGSLLVDGEEYGFYVKDGAYHFKTKDGYVCRSNFILVPIFHIDSAINAKRLYEVKHINGMTRVVEIPQKDMISLTSFQLHIESLGNFWFDGTQADLMRLKKWLYDKTESCKELIQLGWQKEGFWAWGNGIFNSEFSPVDSYGIAKHGNKSYYIPAFSNTYKQEEGLFTFEKKFIHMESNITLKEYCSKFVKVFGDNAKIAMCFYFSSLFRDIVVQRFGIYPVLNMFGPKGAGKTACAESIVQFFGRLGKAPNVHNTSLAALGEHVATSCNAICHIDEYRNDIDMMKREFLKGLWDGSGRSKMNMEKDKKKEMTLVDQAIILTGQQMATADIALLSRLIFLSFTQTEYSDKEREDFVALKEIEKRGLTHITHQILRLRSVFKEKYPDHVKKVNDRMRELIGREQIEDRIFNNWLIPIAAYSTLNEHLELPWDEDELIRLAVGMMIEQNRVTKKNDDLGNFWKVVQYLISSNLLFEGGDYKVVYEDKVTRRYFENREWGKQEINLKEPTDLLYITTSRIFSLYKSQCLKEGDKPLPDSTIEYYLKNSAAFLCETKKESFKKIDPRTGLQEVSSFTNPKTGFPDTEKKRTSTTALVFYLDKTGLTLSEGKGRAESGDGGTEKTEKGEVEKPEATQVNMFSNDPIDGQAF